MVEKHEMRIIEFDEIEAFVTTAPSLHVTNNSRANADR